MGGYLNYKTGLERMSLERFCKAAHAGSGWKQTEKKQMTRCLERMQRWILWWMVHERDDLEVGEVKE